MTTSSQQAPSLTTSSNSYNSNVVTISGPIDWTTATLTQSTNGLTCDNITLKGESLNDRLSRIEQVLNIPTRDLELEEKYSKLKRLFQEYRAALEEYKTWERIKNEK